MSVVSTLSGRPVSAKRLTMTDQAALEREYRTLRETNQNQNQNQNNTNKQCKLPKSNSNVKTKNYKSDMQKKLQNIQKQIDKLDDKFPEVVEQPE